jgi:hypothetical protein
MRLESNFLSGVLEERDTIFDDICNKNYDVWQWIIWKTLFSRNSQIVNIMIK